MVHLIRNFGNQVNTVKQHLIPEDVTTISLPFEDEDDLLEMMKTAEGKEALEQFLLHLLA